MQLFCYSCEDESESGPLYLALPIKVTDVPFGFFCEVEHYSECLFKVTAEAFGGGRDSRTINHSA